MTSEENSDYVWNIGSLKCIVATCFSNENYLWPNPVVTKRK